MASNKYGAQKATCNNGHCHDSKREAKRCDELHLLQRGGQIQALTMQPKFTFVVDGAPIKMGNGHAAKYTPDFEYMEAGKRVVEDVKGFIVRDFPLRAALFRLLNPDIELRVVK